MTLFGPFILSLLVTLCVANSVHFINQDGTTRTLIFTPEVGHSTLEPLKVEGNAAADQTFPSGWTGNWYSVSEGAQDVPGMLGEVRFDGFNGFTFFDVSAIVNPNDNQGVKELFPASTNTPVSGCQSFPCANAYNQADDLQTASTPSKELICLIGNVPNLRRRGIGMVKRIFDF